MLGLWQVKAQNGLTEAAQAESAVPELGSNLLDVVEEAKVLAAQAEAAARLLLVSGVPAEAHQGCCRIPETDRPRTQTAVYQGNSWGDTCQIWPGDRLTIARSTCQPRLVSTPSSWDQAAQLAACSDRDTSPGCTGPVGTRLGNPPQEGREAGRQGSHAAGADEHRAGAACQLQ